MPRDQTISDQIMLFVCLHGSAKSLIAMACFNRLAAENGSTLRAVSAGTEPDDAVSPEVAAGLAGDGFDVGSRVPLRLTPELLSRAAAVVSFGPDIPGPAGVLIRQWHDMPAVSDDYAIARDAIRMRVAALFPDVTSRFGTEHKGETHDR